MESLIEDFQKFFDIVYVNNDKLKKISQKLRYQVYCVENPYLERNNYPGQVEEDEYDNHSIHSLLLYRPSNSYIATVRIVLSNPSIPGKSFPIENFEILRRSQRDKIWQAPRESLGEISRFAVSKQFRRRSKEAEVSHGITEQLNETDWHTLKRWYPHITLGLFRAVVQMSKEHNINYWYAVMEPALIRLLARVGILFTPVGPLVDYHGVRQPCIGVTDKIVNNIQSNRYDVWEFITRQIEIEAMEASEH